MCRIRFANRVDSFSTKEPETLRWLDEARENDVFFDIGSNVGIYSNYYAALKRGAVYAFEPSVFNLAQRVKNIYMKINLKSV